MATVVFVCEYCHETDKKVTGCRTAPKNHCGQMASECDVCGKYAIVGPCYAYRRLEKKLREQKAITAAVEDNSNIYCS